MAFNCTHYPALEPNSDISGIGVLYAFLGTAYLTLICCVAKAFLDPKSSSPDSNPALHRWSFALESVIIVLSDQQIVTGISIILGGISQLRSGLPVYHWQSVVNLAWFSTMTHLITLTVLRDEVRSNKSIRILRVVGMGVLIAMLIGTIVPIGYLMIEYEPPPNFPAWCLYQPTLDWGYEQCGTRFYSGAKVYNWLYVAIVLSLLTYSYVSRVILLFWERDSISQLFHRLLRNQPWKSIEAVILRLKDRGSGPAFVKATKLVLFKLAYSVYAIIVSGYDLYSTRVWETSWLTGALVWGTVRIFAARAGGAFPCAPGLSSPVILIPSDLEGVVNNQNVWGFGQVVSLALLVLPLSSFFGAFFSKYAVLGQEHTDPTPVTRFQSTFFHYASKNSAPSLSVTSVRSELCNNPCYGKLLWLWYFFSVEMMAAFVSNFAMPEGNPAFSFFDIPRFGETILLFSIRIALDVLILWLSALLFLDRNLQRIWKRGKVCGSLARKPTSTIAWIFGTIILFGWLIYVDVIFGIIRI